MREWLFEAPGVVSGISDVESERVSLARKEREG